MLKPNEDAELFDHSYSNFDGEKPSGAEKALRDGMKMLHPAREHHGTMWFEDGKFHEAVYRYGTHVATISADTLEELFNDVNDEFGHG